jgi:hypothetical protein
MYPEDSTNTGLPEKPAIHIPAGIKEGIFEIPTYLPPPIM